MFVNSNVPVPIISGQPPANLAGKRGALPDSNQPNNSNVVRFLFEAPVGTATGGNTQAYNPFTDVAAQTSGFQLLLGAQENTVNTSTTNPFAAATTAYDTAADVGQYARPRGTALGYL
jgi:hypothetical protein